MIQNNYIPKGNQNRMALLMQFQKFKHDFYNQNGSNADPKAAVMQYMQQNAIDQDTLNQVTSLANQLGIK